jgi:hypothetical protein
MRLLPTKIPYFVDYTAGGSLSWLFGFANGESVHPMSGGHRQLINRMMPLVVEFLWR